MARRYACRMSAPSTTTPWLAQQSDVGFADGLGHRARVALVVDRSPVLVVHRDGAVVQRAGLVVDLRGASDIGPDRSPPRVVVDRHRDIATDTVQFDVQRDRRCDRPPACDLVAVGIHGHDVARGDLVPRQSERVHKERAVGLLIGDVAGEMVVVSLGEQATAQQRQFLGGGQVGQRRRDRFRDRHRAHRCRPCHPYPLTTRRSRSP